MRKELITFVDTVRALQFGVEALFPVESQLAQITIGEETGGKKKDKKKWFETCFEQIYKSSTALLATLPTTTNTP